ncbi:S8 family peptidase [Crocinitomicaceae bacterium]|nr:S8 family peptidase [Crocinitomicaceae bacterium]
MNKIIIKLSLAVFAIGITNVMYAQTKEEKKAAKAEEKRLNAIPNWYNGKGPGMNTEKAYKMLKNRETETVVVAIIDSGVDIEHEDLQGRIWVNEDEIAGNGIDDDNNGYIDDVHGWNFLGNANGENANDIRLEMTRIYADLDKKYGKMPVSITNEQEQEEYDLYLEVKGKVEAQRAQAEQIVAIIKQRMGAASEEQKAQLQGALDYYTTQYDVHYNPDHNGRAIVGDDPNDFSDTNYGNNDVEGPDALHGTHVGGIVGAVRGNEIGYDGVAHDIKLMSLRAVPNGDEFDKDIALAIRYAVDNGAKVINMSFGKAYSPHAEEVFEAFKYADSKGVLCIHAAGNDHKDIDEEPNFPTSMYDFQMKKLDHFLTIGASTRYVKEDMLPAPFSNYAERGVDVFAPGMEILNTVPQSEYQELQGTSMACPMVSGAAAFLKSYFPKMSMKDISDVLLKSATPFRGELQVKPGGMSRDEELESDMVDFGNLSTTGGIINLAEAVKMCLEMEK